MQCFLSHIIQFPTDSIERMSSLGNTNMAARWLHCLWCHELSIHYRSVE